MRKSLDSCYYAEESTPGGEVSEYDLAQYCRNGHEITQSGRRSPERLEKYCSTCGAPTLTACERCKAPIRGMYLAGAGIVIKSDRPNHCYNCGAEHSWVAEKLTAAREMVAFLEDLSDEEKQQLNKSLEDIVGGGPRTELGVFRFKALLGKVRQGSQEFLYKLAVDVASEAAKKMLTPS